MFVGDSSTTCSMMSLMESILTTELTKSFKHLAVREYSWVHRLDDFLVLKEAVHEDTKYSCDECIHETGWKEQLTKHKKPHLEEV